MADHGDLDDATRSLHAPDAEQASADDALLAESHRLFLETQELLASLADAPSPASSRSTTSSPTEPARPAATRSAAAATRGERRLATRRAQAAKRRVAYNQRLQHEWQTLRRLEGELSDQLTALQQSRAVAKRALPSEREPLSVWKAIATRQLEGRLVAEAQNRRLRDAVTRRTQVLREQYTLVSERCQGRDADLQAYERHEAVAQEPVRLTPEDTALFEAYLAELDAIYAETDAVFRDCGVAESPRASYRQDPVRRRHGELEFVENLDVLLLPFACDEASSAMWRAMQAVHRQSGRKHYDGVVDPANTLATKYRIGFRREAGDVVYTMLELAMRRYVEASRLVLVWRALSEGEGEFAGMHSDETGWCVVRPLEAPDGPLRTVMQTFVRFVPLDFAGGTRPGGELGDQFTQLVVDSSEEDGLEVARMMERLLLRGADVT